MAKFFTTPTFIPKMLDETILRADLDFASFIIDAHYLSYREQAFHKIVERFPTFIVDPVTYFLQFKEWREKPSFQAVPYSEIVEIQQVLSDPTYRLEKLVIPAINLQKEAGSSFIVAPYFCADDINNVLFQNNLTMLGETLYMLKNEQPARRVLAPICIGASNLRSKLITDYIISSYKDDSLSEVSGYIITVTDFDDREADEEQLFGLADIVYQLSQDKDVIVNHIGGFGEILNAIGASAFTSSPGGGEMFFLKQMQLGNTESRGRKHSQWRYVPELFDYINEDELVPERFNYSCDCVGCADVSSFPSIYSARKVHAIIKRMDRVREMASLNRQQRIDLMMLKLSEGYERAINFSTRYGSDLRTAHILRWQHILERARAWDYEADDDELSRFLSALD